MARKKKVSRNPAKAPLMLRSLAQLKALAHPTRYRMFERLTDFPATGKQLAEALKKPPTQLYHHLRLLEREGLIEQVETRKKRGTTEKYYTAVSGAIAIDSGLFEGKVEGTQAVRGQALRVACDEVYEAEHLLRGRKPKPPIMVKRLRIQSTRAKIEQLQASLNEWLDSFADSADDDADANYTVTVAFYPTKIMDSW